MLAAVTLERFLEAQERVYRQALGELTAGAKQSHWMWFVFPQVAGLGHSPTAQFYALAGLAEAREYLAHPMLGRRLHACVAAVMPWAGKRTALAIFGPVDAMKFRSSLTLFETAANDPTPFAEALDAFFGGERDAATLARL